MTNIKKSVKVILQAVLALAMISACGGNDASESDDNNTSGMRGYSYVRTELQVGGVSGSDQSYDFETDTDSGENASSTESCNGLSLGDAALSNRGELYGEAKITADPAKGTIKAYAEGGSLGAGPDYEGDINSPFMWGYAGVFGYFRQVFEVVSTGDLQEGASVNIAGIADMKGHYEISDLIQGASMTAYLYINHLNETFTSGYSPDEYTYWWDEEDEWDDPFTWFVFLFEYGVQDGMLAYGQSGKTYSDGMEVDDSIVLTADVKIGDVIVLEYLFSTAVSLESYDYEDYQGHDNYAIADFYDDTATTDASLTCLTDGAALEPYKGEM